ncbi:uncharacterized protein LOC129966405 [Argiope bruennichi]|uniref:uncharacterized protein LOC129966405 n=1 Tax=Argiope bruennichi TaxID=94029 RepID=UPI002493E173|nr:uncharacterized protein LOC129966405 [Argiope bruennichi]
MKRKLAAIQRPILLAISGAYRTTSTAALQIILGIPPLHLQLQREAKGISLYRLKNPTNNCDLQISQLEIDYKISGWTSHPSVHLEDQISLDDGPEWNLYRWIENEQGSRSSAAEFLKSTSATSTIYVDNRASNLAAKIQNPITNVPGKSLKYSKNANIKISWIKAHDGYAGNEREDRLAKQAADSDSPIQPEPYPISFIKSSLRRTMLEKWQTEWDNSESGRLIYQLLPKATQQLTPWRREEILFFTGHGPFPTYLKRFNLADEPYCTCGEVGSPLHYATECILTTSYHLTNHQLTSNRPGSPG